MIVRKKNLPQAGFTLLEVMVVLAIIGLMIALVGINLQRDTNRLALLEAQRFMAVVNEVRDEAIIAGDSYFLILDGDDSGYHFTALRGAQSLADDGLLKPRKLEQGVTIEWEVMEQFRQTEEDSDADIQDRVLISPLGEITPFDARFSGSEATYHVYVNDDYQLQRKADDFAGG